MLGIKRNIPTSQPVNPLPVHPFWLAMGVVDAIVPAWKRSSVRGIPVATTGTVSDNVGWQGACRSIASEGANFDDYAGAWSQIAAPYSLLTLYRLTATPGGSVRIAGNFNSSAYGYEIGPSATNYRWIVSSSSLNTIISGNAVDQVMQCDIGTTDGTTAYYYQQGKLAASGAVSGTLATAAGAFRIGRDNATGNSAKMQVFLTVLFRRNLNPSEVQVLAANPWQIFAAPRRRLWGGVPPIAFDASANSGYQAAASTYTFNRTCSGTSRYLTVDVALLSAGQTVTSIVDDNGGGNVAMAFIGAKSTVSSVGRIESWGLIAPTTGTKQIQVNLSGSIASSSVAVSYTGVHQTTPTEAYNSAQATNVGAADATVTITPVADKTWIHAAIATNDGSITANQTSRNNVTGVGGSGANEDTGPISPAAATAMSYTNVGALQTWAIGGYALRPTTATSSNITLALVGQALTFAQGVIGNLITAALSGLGLTISQGSPTVGVSQPISGQDLTASQGSPAIGLSKAMIGQDLTESQGSIGIQRSNTLAGQDMTSSQGTVSLGSSKPIAGQDMTTTPGSLGVQIDSALSGQDLTLTQGTYTPAVSSGFDYITYARRKPRR